MFNLTCECDGNPAGSRVSSSVSSNIGDFCVSKWKLSKLMSLHNCERFSGVVMEQWFIPLNVHIICVGDELGRRFTEVNDWFFCI